jgi:chromosome segregation ATPase
MFSSSSSNPSNKRKNNVVTVSDSDEDKSVPAPKRPARKQEAVLNSIPAVTIASVVQSDEDIFDSLLGTNKDLTKRLKRSKTTLSQNAITLEKLTETNTLQEKQINQYKADLLKLENETKDKLASMLARLTASSNSNNSEHLIYTASFAALQQGLNHNEEVIKNLKAREIYINNQVIILNNQVSVLNNQLNVTTAHFHNAQNQLNILSTMRNSQSANLEQKISGLSARLITVEAQNRTLETELVAAKSEKISLQYLLDTSRRTSPILQVYTSRSNSTLYQPASTDLPQAPHISAFKKPGNQG